MYSYYLNHIWFGKGGIIMKNNFLGFMILGSYLIFMFVGCNGVQTNMEDLDNIFEKNDVEEIVETVDLENYDDGFTAGKWKNNTYINEYFNFELELPKDYTKFSNNALKKNSLYDDKVYLLLAESDNCRLELSVMDLYEVDEGITKEDIELFNFDVFLKSICDSANENTFGMGNIERKDDEKMGENNYAVLKAEQTLSERVDGEYSLYKQYEKYYFLKKDNYIFSFIIITWDSEDEINNIVKRIN